MNETADSPYSGFSKRPYSPLWWVVGIVSWTFTDDAISNILQKAGVRHGIASGAGLVLGFGLALAFAFLDRVEKRNCRIAIIVVASACCAGLWYWSR